MTNYWLIFFFFSILDHHFCQITEASDLVKTFECFFFERTIFSYLLWITNDWQKMHLNLDQN